MPKISSSSPPEWPEAIDLHQAYQGKLTRSLQQFWLPGLASGVVAGIIGSSGSGKSWLALLLAHDWAVSSRLSGQHIMRTGRIGYVALEAGHELPKRLEAIGSRLSLTQRRQAEQTLLCLDWSESPTDWELQYNRLAVVANNTDLIIVDNLRRLHPFDENSNEDMSRVMSRLQILAGQTHTTLLILHHTPLTLETNPTTSLRGRGAGVITNTLRWVASLRQKEGVHVLTVEVAHEQVAPGTELGQFIFDESTEVFRPLAYQQTMYSLKNFEEDAND